MNDKIDNCNSHDMIGTPLCVTPHRFPHTPPRWVLFEPKRNKNSYHFRGPIDVDHLVNDCIRDKKLGFIAIGDEAIVGVSKQLKAIPEEFSWLRTVDTDDPFFLFRIVRRDIPAAMKFLKSVRKIIKKDAQATAKRIAADKKDGKFSNAPKTKVMVF